MNGFAGSRIPPAPSFQPTPRHHCACDLTAGECHCQGNCCNSSGESKTSLCQQTSPLATPEAPRVIPPPSLKEYLSAAPQFARNAAAFSFVKPAPQSLPSTWSAPPDTPPPRFISGTATV